MKGFRLLLLLFAADCLMPTVGAEQNGTIIPHLSFSLWGKSESAGRSYVASGFSTGCLQFG